MAQDCTPQGIAIDSHCFTCLPEKQLAGMMVYLLGQLLLAQNPMVDVSPAALSKSANCYTACLSGKGLLGAMVYLLCQLVGGGGGDVGLEGITHANGPPPVDGSITTLLYRNDLTGFHYVNLNTVAAPDWDSI